MDKLKLKLIAEDFEEEAFYEDIEAPRFVDLTRSDPFLVDDRYWFCSRVGCDLKHEQEIDVEAINKNFILRVMAARSPNLGFQKALNKRREKNNKKCPLSAPPKLSKSRIPRLALLSSVSHKLFHATDKTQPPPKPTSTPKARVKHVAAKYMTTPRVKNPVSDSKPFFSVRNQPRNTSSSIPKPKLVAKVLTFASPKKKVMKAKSVEDQNTATTPLKNVCDGMKKLDITDQKKGITAEMRSKRACKKVLGNTKTREENEKSSGHAISKIKGVAQNKGNTKSVLCEVKPRDICSPSTGICTAKKGVAQKKSNTKSVLCEVGARDITTTERKVAQKKTNTKSVLCKVETGEVSSQHMDTVSNTTEKSFSSGPCSESENLVNGEDTTVGSSDKISLETTDCGQNSLQDTTEERTLVVDAQRTEVDRSYEGSRNDQNPSTDEKENAPCSDINRDGNTNHGQPEVDKGVKQESSKKTKVLKYIKQKTTNPKPFRLRTDERMILKEATLERKQQEGENQVCKNVANTNKMVTGKVQSGITNKSKKNQEALMGTRTQTKSASAKNNIVSCKSQQNDTSKKVSTFTRMTPFQKRGQRTLQRTMITQAKPEGAKASPSLQKRPATTLKNWTR